MVVARQLGLYRTISIFLSLFLVSLFGSNLARAQSSEQKFSVSAQAQADSMSVGDVFTLGALASYNRSDHFGIDVGVPVHFTRDPSFLSNSALKPTWNNGVGDPYARLRYRRDFSGVNFSTMLTASAPVASYPKGLTTGRVGVDWFNHVDVAVHKLTPFGNVDFANGLLDRPFLTGPYNGFRPFQTLGFVSDVEGGAAYALHRRLSLGGSAFEILPSGRQKLFSRLVAEGTSVPGLVDHNRFFEHQFETLGPSDIARDDGFTGWGTLTLNHSLDVQVGYTRSVHYAFNALGVTLTFHPSSFASILRP